MDSSGTNNISVMCIYSSNPLLQTSVLVCGYEIFALNLLTILDVFLFLVKTFVTIFTFHTQH